MQLLFAHALYIESSTYKMVQNNEPFTIMSHKVVLHGSVEMHLGYACLNKLGINCQRI